MSAEEDLEAVLREMRSITPYDRGEQVRRFPEFADRLCALFDKAVEEAARERIAGMQREAVAWISANDYACLDGLMVFPANIGRKESPLRTIPLYTIPPNAQALIDAAMEVIAAWDDLPDDMDPIMAKLRRALGKPLNDSKGG